MADDEDLARLLPESKPATTPSFTEWSSVVERLTILIDRVGELTAAVASGNAGKKVKPPKPLPRPVTARQRIKSQSRRKTHDYIVNLVKPGNSRQTMADVPNADDLRSLRRK